MISVLDCWLSWPFGTPLSVTTASCAITTEAPRRPKGAGGERGLEESHCGDCTHASSFTLFRASLASPQWVRPINLAPQSCGESEFQATNAGLRPKSRAGCHRNSGEVRKIRMEQPWERIRDGDGRPKSMPAKPSRLDRRTGYWGNQEAQP
jgi:hypothetical protein